MILVIFSIYFFIQQIYFVSLISVSILIGFLIYFNTTYSSIKNPYPITLQFSAYVQGKIKSIKSIDENKIVFILKGNVATPAFPELTDQIVLVRYYQPQVKLYAGDIIKFTGNVRLPKKKVLPNEFDEQSYYAGLDIQWIANAKKVALVERKFDLYTIRDYLRKEIKFISEKIFRYNQASIVLALILGDKSEIDPEVKKLYAYSGTAHVLALSGLHIGVISFVIYLFVSFLRQKHLKFIIFVLVLIAYNFLTEFQHSAIRASFMAILIFYAQTYEKQYNLLNIASFVILVSLIFSSNLIYSISFQMSSLAILGITLFYKPFYKFFEMIIKPKNRFFDYLKGSFAITFAASSILTPLIAHYFKTFSLISFISNLFVVPIFSIVLICSLIAIFFYLVYAPIAYVYGDLVSFLLLLTNEINLILTSIPFSYFKGEYTMFLAVIFSILTVYLFTSNNYKLFITRSFVTLVTILLAFNFYSQSTTEDEIINKRIIPRDQLVATLVRYNDTTLFVYLADRKPAQYPKSDQYLIDFLGNLKDNLIIAVNGNAGINTTDKLKTIREFEYIELSPTVQKIIEEKLFPNTYVSQIIDVIDEN